MQQEHDSGELANSASVSGGAAPAPYGHADSRSQKCGLTLLREACRITLADGGAIIAANQRCAALVEVEDPAALVGRSFSEFFTLDVRTWRDSGWRAP